MRRTISQEFLSYEAYSLTVQVCFPWTWKFINLLPGNQQVKPLDHPHDLPPPNKKGRTYICSCMIYLRPTDGAKLVMKKWIKELKEQPWSKKIKSNDQPAFNWALNKTAGEVCLFPVLNYGCRSRISYILIHKQISCRSCIANTLSFY